MIYHQSAEINPFFQKAHTYLKTDFPTGLTLASSPCRLKADIAQACSNEKSGLKYQCSIEVVTIFPEHCCMQYLQSLTDGIRHWRVQ